MLRCVPPSSAPARRRGADVAGTKRGEAPALKQGDHVEWNTSQGLTRGTVKKKLTSPMDIAGHHVGASAANPEYLVQSDKSGKQAAHKPGALRKTSR
jgi:hypothetical protein